MALISIIKSLVVNVAFIILVTTSLSAAKSDLAKIFRTPRDFDHMEIIERTGFDHAESTTFQPLSDRPINKSKKKNRNNYANAQVSVRFGTDYGNSHVMKIPPQCRHLISNGMNHLPNTIPNPNFYYPPPFHTIPPPCPSHQYYHPYPPPVPYIFPNYYFWCPGEQPAYLPPQLNEYFRRHPDFVVKKYPYDEEVSEGEIPLKMEQRKNILVPVDVVDGKIVPLDLKELSSNRPQNSTPVNFIRSRILRPLDSKNETEEDNHREIKEMKRDLLSLLKENEDDVGNTISAEFSDSFEESPYQTCSKNDTSDQSGSMRPESSTENIQKQANDLEVEISEPDSQDVQKQIINSSDVQVSEQSTEQVQKQPDVSIESNIPETKDASYELEELLIQSPKIFISYPAINGDDISIQNLKPKMQPSSCPYCENLKQDKFSDNFNAEQEDIIKDATKTTCQCNNNSANKPARKGFIKDVDDLITVVIEIIDTDKMLPSIPPPKLPDVSSIYPNILPQIIKPSIPEYSFLYPDFISPFNPVVPITTALLEMLNLALENYGSSNIYERYPYFQRASNSSNKIRAAQPGHPSSSDGMNNSDPKAIVAYKNAPEQKTENAVLSIQPQIENRRFALPESCLSTKKESTFQKGTMPRYLKIVPLAVQSKQTPNIVALPSQETYQNVMYLQDASLPPVKAASASIEEPVFPKSFQPEANAALKVVENMLPKYVKIIPRPDLELVVTREVAPVIDCSNIPADEQIFRNPESIYCRKCGHQHTGGNYCDKCGYPLIFYQSQIDPYCPSCTKETRQINEW